MLTLAVCMYCNVTAKEIDHVLISNRWTMLQNCRVYRSLEFSTDHCPVIASLALKMRRNNNNTHSQHLRYNIRKLNDPEIESQYSVEVQNRFSLLSNEEASDWDTFRNAVTGAASTCLGHDVQPKKEWITDSSWQLIEEKRVARLQGRAEDYKRLTKQCKTQLRKDRQHWADDMAELGELALETGQKKDAFC